MNQKESAARTESRAEPSRPRPEAVRRIVVSIPDRQVALLEDGQVVKVYPVAVGAFNQPTPSGTFEIVTRIPDPTYYRPGIVIPPGPANPLGSRWLGLSRKGMGIHGTNEPDSIGKSLSNGCIRLHNRDVEELFEMVRAGDRVEIYVQRNTELVAIF
ncbi:MAG TPA: L,D-transpeptidase, partial [Candidatus Acidoferrales bacterium]